jgi:hypothetical protein
LLPCGEEDEDEDEDEEEEEEEEKEEEEELGSSERMKDERSERARDFSPLCQSTLW